LAAIADHHGLRISGADVDQVQVRIVRGRLPRRAAAAFHRKRVGPGFRAWLPGAGSRVPFPLNVPCFRVARLQPRGNVHIVAAGPDEDMVTYDCRRRSGIVIRPDVCDLLVPALLAVSSLERDHVIVRRLEEDPVAIYADPAVPDVHAAPGLPEVMPDLLPRTRVNRKG